MMKAIAPEELTTEATFLVSQTASAPKSVFVDEEEQENEEGWWFVPTDQLNANHRSDILGGGQI